MGEHARLRASWVPYGANAAYFRLAIRDLRNCSPLGRTSQGGCTDQGAAATAELLEILLEHPGEVVTREQLRSRIWPNESFGDFDQAVNVAIAKLRGALGDSADNPRYIETLPRRGYRFIAQVDVVNRPDQQTGTPRRSCFSRGRQIVPS